MGFSHFHGSFSNPSPFKGEVRRGMGYICRCSNNETLNIFRIEKAFVWVILFRNQLEMKGLK